jgi:hypothetical protein
LRTPPPTRPFGFSLARRIGLLYLISLYVGFCVFPLSHMAHSLAHTTQTKHTRKHTQNTLKTHTQLHTTTHTHTHTHTHLVTKDLAKLIDPARQASKAAFVCVEASHACHTTHACVTHLALHTLPLVSHIWHTKYSSFPFPPAYHLDLSLPNFLFRTPPAGNGTLVPKGYESRAIDQGTLKPKGRSCPRDARAQGTLVPKARSC